MHGLTLTTVPPGATTRPLAERPAGSRTIESLAPSATRTPLVEYIVGRSTESGQSLRREAARRRGDLRYGLWQRAGRSEGELGVA